MRGVWGERVMGAAVVVVVVGAYQLGRARADGIPTAPTMYFGATLDEGGVPVSGTRDVTVRLYDAATAGTALCSPPATSAVVTAGRLRVPLDGACTSAVQANPNVWAELSVNGVVVGGRSKLGAVPYAVEAQRADGLTDRALSRLANPDCPNGYVHDLSDTTITALMRLCVRTVTLGGVAIRDEVVRVGAGASAFWVDRYEASAHLAATGVRLGESNAAGGTVGLAVETSGLTASGQRPRDAAGPAQALSHTGQPTVSITWFQANEACRASGKRLLERDEWFAAASGTVDGAACNVSTSGARAAAASNGCTSTGGAHDMIGNVWEWTSEWYASTGQVTSAAQTTTGTRVTGIRVNDALTPWPADYNGDGTSNITSTVYNDAEGQIGIPSAALHGGSWTNGTRAGVFALLLNDGPSYRNPSFGFRCVLPG